MDTLAAIYGYTCSNFMEISSYRFEKLPRNNNRLSFLSYKVGFRKTGSKKSGERQMKGKYYGSLRWMSHNLRKTLIISDN
jgi:hypothetical protein